MPKFPACTYKSKIPQRAFSRTRKQCWLRQQRAGEVGDVCGRKSWSCFNRGRLRPGKGLAPGSSPCSAGAHVDFTGHLHQLSVIPIAWLARGRKERHHGFEEWCVSRLAWVSPPDEILLLLRQLDTMLWEQARRSWGNDQAAQHMGHPARRRKFPSQF